LVRVEETLDPVVAAIAEQAEKLARVGATRDELLNAGTNE
jgi:hypothetical protein